MMKRSLSASILALLIQLPFHALRAAPGDLESLRADADGSSGKSVYVVLPQLDGNILVGGWFQTLAGVSHNNMARLFAGGSPDNGYLPATDGSATAVRSIAVLPGGRALISGEFSTVNGAVRGRAAILNANGTVDPGFDPGLNEYVYSSAVLPDGRVLFGGSLTTAFGAARSRIVRLNANLSLDTAFNPAVNSTVRVMMEQPDGKLIIGGNFTGIGATARNRLARLNPDGTVDAGFNPNVDGPVYSANVLGDGKILAGGSFATVGGFSRQNLVRLHPNGSVDTTFTTGADGIVRTLAPQTDGRIIVGGEFNSIGGTSRSRFARLNADGTVNAAFNLGANGTVFSAALQRDGKVLLGGAFSKIGSSDRVNLARLSNDPAGQSLTVPGPGRIQWLRTGASPEARHVTFDFSPNGSAPWSRLGTGTRIANGWEITGISLPVSGYISAQARIYAGYSGASSSLEEFTIPFTFTPLQVWRQSNFGISDNTGNAANHADPDNDGLDNLVEFAFGLQPGTPDTHLLPQWEFSDSAMVLEFTSPDSAGGISYIAEYSTSIASGSWLPVPNFGLGRNFLFQIPPVPGSRLYLRVRVLAGP